MLFGAITGPQAECHAPLRVSAGPPAGSLQHVSKEAARMNVVATEGLHACWCPVWGVDAIAKGVLSNKFRKNKELRAPLSVKKGVVYIQGLQNTCVISRRCK